MVITYCLFFRRYSVNYKIQGNWESVKVEPKNDANLTDLNDRYKNMQETDLYQSLVNFTSKNKIFILTSVFILTKELLFYIIVKQFK